MKQETQKWRRFYLITKQPQGGRVVEYIDEHSNALAGRIRSFSPTKNKQRRASNYYDIAITFELELTSEELTLRTGGTGLTY